MKTLFFTTTVAAITAAALLLFTGCNKFLDTELKSDFSPNTYFSSAENAEQAVNGIYNSLYGTKYWIYGDVASDDAVKGGNEGDQIDISSIDDFTAASDNGHILMIWQKMYETVSQCNNVITYVGEMNIQNKDRYIGEAKFIRAYTYFWLVNIFGSVPYKDKPQETAEAIYVGLSTPAAIYTHIEQDLNDAAAALPPSYSGKDNGRATKGAALALLAKVQLFQNKTNECISSITMLENLGQYNLIEDYSQLFKSGAEDCEEAIFTLRFINTTDASLGNEYVVYMAPFVEGGYHFNAPTQNYVDCFTERTDSGATDPRLDASIGRGGQPWFGGRTFDASWSSTGYLVKKYNEENPTGVPIGRMTVPVHLLRYADVLLMKAEALAAQQPDSALSALNKVRARAHLLPANSTNLQEKIRLERRRELGFEAHRFFDIMRYGKAYAENALANTGFTWVEPRFYYTIPQLEIDANDAIK
jgi:hypothetical protein